MITIKLKELAIEIEDSWDGWYKYLNTETGEYVTVPDECNDTADIDHEDIPDVSGDEFIQLPSQWDIHEYSIMEDFAGSVEDERIRGRLLYALTHSHPYRRFKDEIKTLGIADSYYAFRLDAITFIAERWCRYYEIPYDVEE